MSEQQFAFKPKTTWELTKEEVEKIPEEEKKILMAQQGEEHNIFEATEGKYGPYERVTELTMMSGANHFYQLLLSGGEKGFDYVAFGGFKFSKKNGYINRSKMKEKWTGGAKGGGSRFKPRYLEEVFLGDVDAINQKVKDGEWQISFPAVVINDKILIVKNK